MPNTGFDDAFFEERFHPSKPVFDEQTLSRLRESENRPIESPELKHLEFEPGLDRETVCYLKKLVKAQLEFAALRGFLLRDANHPVKFTDSATYEQQMGSPLPANIPLPASRLDYLPVSKVYSVTIVLPQNLKPAEVRINLTRTLFSKLFGEIHFQENILPQEFFQNRPWRYKDLINNTSAILELLNTLDYPSERFLDYCEAEAPEKGQPNNKDPGKAIRMKVRDWMQKCEEQKLGSTETNLLQSIYSEFLENLKKDPVSIYQKVISQIHDLDALLHLILPHDEPGYRHFEKEHPLQFLRSYANRLEEALSLIGFLEEVELQFKQMEDRELLRGLRIAINTRMRELRRDGKARPYLFSELEQTDTMKRLAAKFPLKMMKWLPPGTPIGSWSKAFQKMEKHYAQSIYARLYLALDAMDRQILKKLEPSLKAPETNRRFTPLISNLRLRSKQLQQWRRVLGIIVDTGEELPDSQKKAGFSVNMLGKAWSYLLSTLLTLEFYLNDLNREFVPVDFSPDHYLGSIHRFIDRQASQGVNAFHAIRLLLLLYEKTPERALEFLHYCLQNPLPTLRYVLDRILSPLIKDESLRKRLDQLPLHSDTLFQAFYSRWQASATEST